MTPPLAFSLYVFVVMFLLAGTAWRSFTDKTIENKLTTIAGLLIGILVSLLFIATELSNRGY